jgi:hypothetical protein
VTADRRLRIGGWAALLAALLTPIALGLLFLASSSIDPATSRPYLLAETARVGALFVAVAGLDVVFRRLDPLLADRIRILGLVGAGAGVGLDAILLGGLGPTPFDLLALPASVLLGLWFLGAGLVLLRAGRDLTRIGWTALAGGLSAILAAIAVVVPLGGEIGETGYSIRDYFVMLGLLAVVFLVRIWRYAVGGRLPAPGIL